MLDPYYAPGSQAADVNVNASLDPGLIGFIVDGRRQYWSQFLDDFTAGWYAVFSMGDDTHSYPFYSTTGTGLNTQYNGSTWPQGLGNFPGENTVALDPAGASKPNGTHGINFNAPPVPAYGTSTAGTLTDYQTVIGLKHLANTVQYGKGVAASSFGISSTLMSGGTNLPAVIEQNGSYATSNIKMSDFHGVRKNATTNSSYLEYFGGLFTVSDGVDEQIYSSGAISFGDAA
jgi:hypothetical protein